MNPYVLGMIMHAAKAIRLLPGDSFTGITSATAGTFMLTGEYKVKEVLLETAPGEPLDEVADYFIDMVAIASDPRKATALAFDLVQGSESPVVTRLFIASLKPDGQAYIRQRMADVYPTLEVGF